MNKLTRTIATGLAAVGLALGGLVALQPAQEAQAEVTPDTKASYVWGTSYARSDENWTQLYYTGRVKAGANVVGTSEGQKRITKVCGTYSRDGKQLSSRCSYAGSSGGQWAAGAEQKWTQSDSLNWNDGKTKFNYSRGLTNPNVMPSAGQDNLKLG